MVEKNFWKENQDERDGSNIAKFAQKRIQGGVDRGYYEFQVSLRTKTIVAIMELGSSKEEAFSWLP